MIKINIYAITDPSLLDDDILYSVCNGTPGMIDGLKGFIYDNANTNPEDEWKYLMDGEYIFNSACAFGAIKDSQVRGMFLADLYSALEEHEVHINHIDVEVKFHIITPDGQIYVIHDFNKISSNLDSLNKQVRENIMKDYIKYQDMRDELEKEIKYNTKEDTSIRKVQSLILSQSLTKLMVKNIEDHKEEFQNRMIEDILTVRQEEEKELKNELDIMNQFMAENNLKEVKSCKYNGVDIALEDLVEKLHMHTLPAYLTQINILDTLQDEYEIVTEGGTIHRLHGGKIVLEK